jgi:hypothetical protein
MRWLGVYAFMPQLQEVFVPNTKLRSEAAAKKDARKLAKHSTAELADAAQTHPLDDEPQNPKRHPWAWLMKKDFLVDVAERPGYGDRMKWRELCTERRDSHRVLAARGLAPSAPPQVGWAPFER